MPAHVVVDNREVIECVKPGDTACELGCQPTGRIVMNRRAA
jgi:hypothetical protein